jgi:hypothetical protein
LYRRPQPFGIILTKKTMAQTTPGIGEVRVDRPARRPNGFVEFVAPFFACQVDHQRHDFCAGFPEFRGGVVDIGFISFHVDILGGFKAVTERLSALADLGIIAIQLMLADFSGRRKLEANCPAPGEAARSWRQLVAELLAIRHRELTMRIDAAHGRSPTVLGPKALIARWDLDDGAELSIATNLDGNAVAIPAPRGALLY